MMDDLRWGALELRILLSIITRISSRALEQSLHAQGLPISALQHSILRLLSRHPFTIAELSRKLGLMPATLVPAVDALERHGLAARSHDPRDRRRTPLVLTEEGTTLLARLPPVANDDVLLIGLASMPAERRDALLALVRELLRTLPDGSIAADDVAAMIRSAAAQAGNAAAPEPDHEQKAGEP